MYTYSYEGETLKSIKVYELDSTLNQSTGVLLSEQSFSHNSSGKSIKTSVTVGGNSYDYEYSYYDEENDKYTLKLPDGSVSTAKTDHLGRKEFDELQLKSGFLSRRYSYTKGAYDADKLNGELKSLPTTDLVESITYENGEKQSYTYNESGDIVTVSLNGELKESYTYDALGRLKTEQNVESGYLTVYSYDNVGNIISKKKYVCQSSEIVTSESGLGTAEVRTYGYATDWKDKLISYNGQGITYDGNGNPTSYRGVTATWEKGRQLKSYGTNSYKYDENGIRISKTVNGTEHKYTLNGSNVVCEEYGTTKLDYLYDIGNSVCGMRVNNGTTYYFRKNLQGDITAITDNEGNIIAKYRYDAWGKVLSTTGNTEIANLNPFRYRGYYYDAETQLYYLNSRYYDPETCRFINADDILTINAVNNNKVSINLFLYCSNNPVNDKDPNGNFALKDLWGYIRNAFGFIEAFVNQAYYKYFPKGKPEFFYSKQQIKKLRKSSKDSEREIKRQLEKIKKNTKKQKKIFGKISTFLTICNCVMTLIYFIQQAINVTSFITMLVIEMFIDGFGDLISWILSNLLKLIPGIGFILGWLGGWIFGIIIGRFFNGSRKNKMNSYYYSYVKKEKKLVSYFIGFFKSFGTLF